MWAAVAVFAVAVHALYDAGFRINETPSLPIGLWRITPANGVLTRGAIVSVCLPKEIADAVQARRYLAKGNCQSGLQPVLKSIAAVSGDHIATTDRGVSVNGTLISSSVALGRDRRGRALHVLPAQETMVQPGEIWLVSTKASSFDSRYFGPVPVSSLEGFARPVAVWKK